MSCLKHSRGAIFSVTINYVSWFIVLYLTAAYLRMYPKKWTTNNKICGALLLLSASLAAASVVIKAHGTTFKPFYYVTDSNTLLAVAVSIFAFLFFRNLRIPYSKCINTLASATFGILLIHANSDTMRKWLWVYTLDNVGHYAAPYMPLYAFGCIIGVFAVCAVIDLLRIRLLEKPFFRWWDKPLSA